jgi:hypothetical protein
LLANRLTGKYIHRVNEGFSHKGIAVYIGIMWCMICLTTFVVFKNNPAMQYVMISLGVIGSIAQIIVLRKKKKKQAVMLENALIKKDDKYLKIS